jgi:two-component system sensor histidine kinase KdpD
MFHTPSIRRIVPDSTAAHDGPTRDPARRSTLGAVNGVDRGQPRRRRGELRIYLGSAPGVGKTYAMLGEARRRRERGTDVVVGYVETHGRHRTAEAIGDLEVVPRQRLVHRGKDFEDMDVDAVLARNPAVAVVDELAHTNVPGCRNPKRWQDVEELLDAGITVLTTVNVQHLESLNDVVERITGVHQRETVPDEVVRRAEQVELVDITPEALRRRMAHGNVYPAHKIDAALSNYFRPGNLTALRELALLWVADKVDVALQRYRHEHDIDDTWEARERIVVAVTGGPESDIVLRRAARIAARAGSGSELMCLHIMGGDGLSGTSPAALGGLRALAESLGASFHTVVGDDVPAALLDYARGVNATQLVLGTSRRFRVARLFDEGIGARVVQHSGSIDVHMVTHPEAAGGRRRPRLGSPVSRARRLMGWLLAVLLPLAVAATGALGAGTIGQSTMVVAFFLVIVLAAVVGGLGPALFAAVASGLLLNFLFTEPRHSLAISSPTDVATVVGMVLVALMVALVVDRAARRAEQAARAGTEAALLASFARTVLTRADPVPRVLERLREAFSLDSVVLLERVEGQWQAACAVGPQPCRRPDDADADVQIDEDVHLAVRGRPLAAHDWRVLEAVAGQALLALRQQRMAAAAAEAQRRAHANELRTALLSAVGHDLRTPLTSIKAAIGSLRDPELRLTASDTAELLAAIEESADRLRALVDNLLDSSRLATGAVVPAHRPVGYDEAVARALAGMDGAGSVVVEVDERLPPVLADPGLLERVIANVVDNALRHGTGRSGDAADVAVRASVHAGRVELRVVDRGPGLPGGAVDTVFAPFERLGDPATLGPGVGLGLSVAKGFTEAMDGTIAAEDTPGGGLTIVISLPVAEVGVESGAEAATTPESATASASTTVRT